MELNNLRDLGTPQTISILEFVVIGLQNMVQLKLVTVEGKHKKQRTALLTYC